MPKGFIVVVLLLGIVSAQKAKVDDVPPIPVETPIWVGSMSKAPAPVIDTNYIFYGSSANLTRQVAVGTQFKGLSDDTIRVVSVQSGGTRYLIVATDTSSVAFGTRKFRIETPYSFPSGATEHAVCIGDVDGDEYVDILTGDNAAVNNKVWLRWFEWDPVADNWVARDSIGVSSGDYINNIVIGDADNDGIARDILFNLANNVASAFMIAKWNGTSFDTVRVTFTGRTQRYRAVAIGDVIPELPGNEVYTGGGTDFAMAYWDGTSWQTTVLSTGLTGVNDISIGDVNPAMPGPEICIVHGSTSYQLSVWNYIGPTFSGIAYTLYTTWGTGGFNDIEIGDFLREIPGDEIIITNTGTAANNYSLWFAYSATGRAYVGILPKVAAAADYGVKIANVNRWRPGNELVLTCGGHIVEMEQRIFTNDLSLLEGVRTLPLIKRGVYDTLKIIIVNPGSTPVTEVTFNWNFQNWPGSYSYTAPVSIPAGGYAMINVPIEMPNQLGIDTLFFSLPADENAGNNGAKFYFEVWDDSTVAASSFSDATFPPLGWTRQIISGTYNWSRYTSGSNPTCTPLDAPAMAGYPSYSASAGSQARLIAPVNVGPVARKVKMRFYMYHDPGYSTSYDSIYVEYSLDGVNFVTLAGYQRYAATAGWAPKDVEIGDFAGNTQLYVALRAKSGYGNNMFIDSLRVFVTEPTAVANDAQLLSVIVPKPVIQNDSNPVSLIVKNSGLDPITSMTLFFTLGGPDTVFETWTGNLPAGMSMTYNFTQPFVPADTGQMTLIGGVILAGDAVPDNNTGSTLVRVWPYAQNLPYSHNFDEAWENSINPPFGGWKIIDGGDEAIPTVNNNDWHRFVAATPARTVARIYFSPVENQNDWLISPRLRIPGYGTYTLSYWHWYRDYSTSTLDSGRVLISFDDGNSWIELAKYSNVSDSGYRSVDLTPYIIPRIGSAEYFRIAFHYGARDEYYWWVDDFSVSFAPDTTPPMVQTLRTPTYTYNTGPDTLIFVVSDISPFSVMAFAVVNDTVIVSFSQDFEPGIDTIVVEIPGRPAGTLFDGYLALGDVNGNGWQGHGAWWKLIAYNAGTPSIGTVRAPDPGVRLGWARPRQSLRIDGGVAYYFTGFYPGDVVAVRFTPQYTPARVDSVVALLYGTASPIHVKIYADNNGMPGEVLFDTLITSPAVYPSYLRLYLSSANIMVNGDYHVGIEWTATNAPYPTSDAGSNTNRSTYFEASSSTWYDWVGVDWIIRSAVTYFPQSKAYVANYTPSNTKRNPALVRYAITGKVEDEGTTKYIEKYTVLRGTTSGGPYDVLGTTSDITFTDYTIQHETQYFYVVRMDYVNPDTMTYSTEVSITTDLVGPQFSAFAYDTGGVNNIWVSVIITDPSGIYRDTLYYSINGADFAFATRDSVVGSTYYYTIPGLNIGDNVDLYFVALDNSAWRNPSRFPETGYISFEVTSITDLKPKAFAFNAKSLSSALRGFEFAYALPERSEVEISIYSVTGQKVATLVKGTREAGYHTVRWNGKDERGSAVGSGVYIVKMITPKKTFTSKLILAK
ncbi:MAG: FlgD immunoglobulin-like domain containing protein [candidate division WOR-3 bacterium]